MADKLIMVAAVCGAATSRKQTPYVPITPDEIADEVISCAQAGASVAHIHVRDGNGQNTMDPERFSYVVDKVKKSGEDIVINLSTACDNVPGSERTRHLSRILPEMASIDMGSMNWANHHVFLNEPAFLEYLAETMKILKIKPEIECFDAGMIDNAKYCIKKGLIKEPPHFQFVLGVPGGLDASAENLDFLVRKLPPGATWGALGTGKNAMKIFLAALSMDAHAVRTGLEDSIYYSRGILAKSNAELVARGIRIARECGREIASPNETRKILGLENQPLSTGGAHEKL